MRKTWLAVFGAAWTAGACWAGVSDPSGAMAGEKPGVSGLSSESVGNSPWWIKAYSGYDYAFLGDLVNGTKNWTPFTIAQGGTGSSSTNNGGWLAGAEAGWCMDRDNAFSLSFETITSTTLSQESTIGGGVQTQSYQPGLTDISANYGLTFHGLIGGKSDRTILSLGGGYYHATVQYVLTQTAGFSNASGTFTGDILGGTVALGQEVALLKDLAFGISFRGRLADFSQVSAAKVTGGQNIIPGSSGPYSLALYNFPSGGTTYPALLFDENSRVGKANDRYASVDYSGFDAVASLSFYF